MELAHEREVVWATERQGSARRSRPAVVTTQLETGPFAPSEVPTAWLPEVIALLKAVAAHDPEASPRQPLLCWGCGRPGHRCAECLTSRRPEGAKGPHPTLENSQGSALTGEGRPCHIPLSQQCWSTQ
ncbi:UNVERIFIED_CONTAM: hypothetical protein FKN15_077058 [Acipenser sinensis]